MDMMKTSRKSHTKTRTGCRNCKKRKIKCDEEKPSCRNCLKHSVRCDFTSLQFARGTSDPDSGTRTPHANDPSRNGPYVREYAPDHHRSPWPASSGDVAPSLSMPDLELLHNFSVSTSFTLSSNSVLKPLWRIRVPQLGFSYEYVMRGILAVSSLHLAHSKPEKRDYYFAQAALHHQAALAIAMPMLGSITEENCTPLYMFSVLTCIFAVGSPRKPGDFLLVGDTGVAEWLFLMRGTRHIISLSSETLNAGVLGPMFSVGKRRAIVHSNAFSQDKRLLDLRALVYQSVERRTADMYATAIDDLAKSLAVAYSISEGGDAFNPETYELTDAFIWPFLISDEFLSLLKQLAQEALSIFAHYCVLMKLLDSHWWMQGWSVHLISQIYSLLDGEHRLWIQWPIEEIGWVPS